MSKPCTSPIMDALYARLDEPEEPHEVLIDALTDVRLWAHAQGLDFHRALDTSYLHYLAEKDVEM